MFLKRRNILVKVNAWFTFAIYWAFLNAKRIIQQRFEINIWSHFACALYLRKVCLRLNRASLNPDCFFVDNNSSVMKVSYLTFLTMFFYFSHISLCNSRVSWEKSSLIKIFLPFNFVAFFKIFVLSLQLRKRHTIVLGFHEFSLFLFFYWVCSFYYDVFSNPQFEEVPSMRRLFLGDRSSNWTTFLYVNSNFSGSTW